MKILQLNYSTGAGGAERILVDLSNELAKENEVTVCIMESDNNDPKRSYYKSEFAKDITYISLGCKRGIHLTALWRIYKAIKSEKPDVVHLHTHLVCVLLAVLLCPKVNFFHTIHNLADKAIFKKWLKPICWLFYKMGRVTPITISTICEDSYTKFYGLSNSVCINNGRSSLTPTEKAGDVAELVQKLKRNADDKVFIHVARCSAQKNQKLLIDTFNRIIYENHHVILIIIGNYFDAKENKPLVSSAKDGIHFLGVKSNVCDYLLSSDYFVLSSLYEGLPISLLEALSCGVIPVSTPAGGVCDVVKSEQVGFVSQSFETEEFYNTVCKALKAGDSISRDFLVEHYNNNFSIEHCARQYMECFSK